MRSSRLCLLCASTTLVLAATVDGCAAQDRGAPATAGVANMQPQAPSAQDQGWATLVEADREMKDLAMIRDQAVDPFRRQAVEQQLADLRARSDRLLDEMTVGDGRVHDAAIRADVAGLQRAMNAHAATELQAR